MKILHLCLASFYIDNYSYQENLLPKYHKKLGFEVEIIASLVSFNENGEQCLLKGKRKYINEYGIPVTRLEYKKTLLSKKFRMYTGTFKAIKDSNPDIIFIHGCQFIDIIQVVKYLKMNPNVKVYVDNHADFSNSAKNWLSKNILHKIIWRRCAQLIAPYTIKFYGVLPARVEFLKKMYKLPSGKVDLLLMGADDEKILHANQENLRVKIRNKYGIKSSDFLIITGGKIDSAKKQVFHLIEAVKKIKSDNVKLIIFGSVTPEMKEKFFSMVDEKKIIYIGWIKSEDCYKYFISSDLGVFPGRHSVLWEQAVGTGLPCLFKYWHGTTHVDVGGNCEFLYNDSIEEVKKCIENIICNKQLYNKMKIIAETKGRNTFSYEKIARKSIGYA